MRTILSLAPGLSLTKLATALNQFCNAALPSAVLGCGFDAAGLAAIVLLGADDGCGAGLEAF